MRTAAERFWRKVDTSGECWLWTARREPKGYGRFKGADGRNKMAHRFAYELLVGPIAAGLELDHVCRTPSCVRPDHLEPVTGEENRRRQHALLTHCQRGHAFDAENTIHRSDGRRRCRTCTQSRRIRSKSFAAPAADTERAS